MKYSLRILKNKNIFKTQISLPKSNEHQIIWKLSYNHWGFLGIAKLSNPKLQENLMSKKRLDAALLS